MTPYQNGATDAAVVAITMWLLAEYCRPCHCKRRLAHKLGWCSCLCRECL
jgi:hypothetical protein